MVLYPCPKDMKMRFGKNKPLKRIVKWCSKYSPKLVKKDEFWCLLWTEVEIREYYLEGLLLHEIGHKVDSYNKIFWRKKYIRKAEKFANNSAYHWSNKLRTEYQYISYESRSNILLDSKT